MWTSEKRAKVYFWMHLIQKLIFFDTTFRKVSSHGYGVPGIKTIEKTVKLKELDEFGTFFKKLIRFLLFIMFWSQIVNSPCRLDFNPNGE